MSIIKKYVGLREISKFMTITPQKEIDTQKTKKVAERVFSNDGIFAVMICSDNIGNVFYEDPRAQDRWYSFLLLALAAHEVTSSTKTKMITGNYSISIRSSIDNMKSIAIVFQTGHKITKSVGRLAVRSLKNIK